jgi:hypothetical protein
MAPPHRASAESRSNENAGVVAIPTGCSRATLMAVPNAAVPNAVDVLEGYNVIVIGWQGRLASS